MDNDNKDLWGGYLCCLTLMVLTYIFICVFA